MRCLVGLFFGALLSGPALPAWGEEAAGDDVEEVAIPEVDSVEAEAEVERGEHCLGAGRSRFVWHHLLVGQYQPLGLEHTGRVGYCVPFVNDPGALWSHTSFEVGVVDYLSPAYGNIGGYIELAPISLLVLRVELTYMAYWPFPINRAGYFSRSGYDDDVRSENLPYELAESADGFNLNLHAVLRAKVDLGPVALVVLNALALSFWQIGDEDYYVQPRYELVMARADWGLTNEAMLMVEIPLPRNIGLRVGVYDALRYGIGSRMVNNNVGLLVMANWPTLGRSVRNLAPFLRVGMYTNHPYHEGPTVTAYLGLLLGFDLSALAE